MAQTRGPVFVLALVGALLLGAALARWLEHGDERASGGGPRAEPRERGGAAHPLTEASAIAEDTAARRATGAGEPESTARATAEAPEVPMGVLAGNVRDSSGRPLAGARVALTRTEARTFEVLDAWLAPAAAPLAETVSGPDGAFRFTLPRGAPVDVLATLEGYGDALVVDAYAEQELELVLTPGVLVFGTITRARDGAPVEGARVRVFRLGGPASLERETTSHPDGSYELRIPFREDAELEVVPAELECSEWIALEPGPDGRCRADVALRDGRTVTGRVTAADTGLALAGATVGEGWWFRRAVTTDARGEYRLRGFGAAPGRALSALAPGYGAARRESVSAAGLADGGLRLDFALLPARAVAGRVLDERGAPLAGAYVAAVASGFGEIGPRTDWLSARSDAAGRYRIVDLSSDLAHALLVAKHGYGTQVHDFPADEAGNPELELPDVVLRRSALLAGRVEDAAGEALGGAELELSGWNHDRHRFGAGVPSRARSFLDQRKARSDARGRFWFADLAAGSYALVARVAGRPASAPFALEIATGERREDLVLRLEAGGTIRGQILDGRGSALAGVYVSAQVERLRDAAARPAGHVHVRSGADGRFELVGLPEGEYTIRAYPLELPGPAPDEPWLPATVEHVATGAQPIHVELPRGASIRGRLLDAGGAPLPGHVVAAVAGAGEPGEFSRTDAEGRFALTVPRGSSWTLEVRGAPEGEAFQTVFLRRAGVPAGTLDLELRLQP